MQNERMPGSILNIDRSTESMAGLNEEEIKNLRGSLSAFRVQLDGALRGDHHFAGQYKEMQELVFALEAKLGEVKQVNLTYPTQEREDSGPGIQ